MCSRGLKEKVSPNSYSTFQSEDREGLSLPIQINNALFKKSNFTPFSIELKYLFLILQQSPSGSQKYLYLYFLPIYLEPYSHIEKDLRDHLSPNSIFLPWGNSVSQANANHDLNVASIDSFQWTLRVPQHHSCALSFLKTIVSLCCSPNTCNFLPSILKSKTKPWR